MIWRNLMIPLRDTVQSRNYPVVNNLIIAINVLLYLVEMAQGQGLAKFTLTYGLVSLTNSQRILSILLSCQKIFRTAGRLHQEGT